MSSEDVHIDYLSPLCCGFHIWREEGVAWPRVSMRNAVCRCEGPPRTALRVVHAETCPTYRTSKSYAVCYILYILFLIYLLLLHIIHTMMTLNFCSVGLSEKTRLSNPGKLWNVQKQYITSPATSLGTPWFFMAQIQQGVGNIPP